MILELAVNQHFFLEDFVKMHTNQIKLKVKLTSRLKLKWEIYVSSNVSQIMSVYINSRLAENACRQSSNTDTYMYSMLKVAWQEIMMMTQALTNEF